MLRLTGLVVAAVVAAGCVAPIAIPALRADAGYSVQGRPGGRIGTHVAGYRLSRDVQWDAGAGYMLSTETFDEMATSAQGAYIEGAFFHRLDRSARLGIGPGISVLVRDIDQGDIVPVGYVRASVELFGPVHASGTKNDRCGTSMGTWRGQAGFGAYVDVQKPMTESGVAVVAGLTVRLPSFAGMAIFIPGCK
jgi:hypothetical protein